MVHVKLEPLATEIPGELGSAVVMDRASIVAEPEQHEGGRTILGGLGVAGVNLENGVAVFVGRRHERRLILYLAAGVIRGKALLGAGQGGAARLEGGVIAIDQAVIDAIGEGVAAAFIGSVRPLNVEVHRRRGPSAATDLGGRGVGNKHARGRGDVGQFA